MAKLPWHKWFHRDWLLSESRATMTLAERGLYRDCLDLNYSEGSIPADEKVLAKVLGVSPEEFAAAWPRVSECFSPLESKPNRLGNMRVTALIDETTIYRNTQAEIARIAAADRAKRKKEENLHEQGSLRVASGKPKGSLSEPSAIRTESESESEQSRTEISVSYETSPPKAPPKTAPVWGESFDEWWAIWPRKVSKGDAEKAYRKVVALATLKPKLAGCNTFEDRHALLMRVTPLWIEREFSGREVTTIPYPATFLRRLDWLEAPQQQAANQPQNGRRISDAELRAQESQRNIREWLAGKQGEGASDSRGVIDIRADLPRLREAD